MLDLIPKHTTLSLLSMAGTSIINQSEKLDEYGFLVLTAEERYERLCRLAKKGIHLMGKGYHCRTLCIHLPHVDVRHVSYRKNGLYYCSICEIGMKCNRCRCCGCLGRMEPRQRMRLNSPHTKFVED